MLYGMNTFSVSEVNRCKKMREKRTNTQHLNVATKRGRIDKKKHYFNWKIQ